MGLLVLLALFLSSPTPTACGPAFDAVNALSKREANYGYAREVVIEGRRAFVSSCMKHLTLSQTRCILSAQTSDELYDCTP
jgi:hypothetical protein